MDRERLDRRIVAYFGVVFGVALLLGAACPQHPVNPPGTDAGAAPAPAPPPAPIACDTACAHAISVCPAVVKKVCTDACSRIGQAYAEKLAAASSCSDVKAADPGAPATQAGPANPNGP